MLSVSKVGSAGGAANYYTQEDNYYFLGSDSTTWFGKGAEKLGLEGFVSKDDFKAVLEGKLPNGDDLSHIRNGSNIHRAGYDFTFSAPKSVSVLALIQEDKSVLDAHKNAVNKVMIEIESLASTREMTGGISLLQPTHNIVSALFMHDTNRNLDPHLHTHAIVANVTFDERSGKFKTLSTDKVDKLGFVEQTWGNQVALGKLYRSFLKEELAQRGFEFETVGKNGLWEIKGFDKEILKEFSSRRQEILDSVSAEASNKSLSVAAKDTRQVKDFSAKEETKQFWKEKFNSLMPEFDVEKIKVSPEQRQVLAIEKNTQIEAIDKALVSVVSELSQEKAKFGRAEITDKIVDKVYFEGGGFSELVGSRIDKMIENKGLIVTDKRQLYFTTPEHLVKEAVATSLIAKLDNQIHNLKAETKSAIAQQIENDHKNFNLFSVRGRVDYESKLIEDVHTLAEENQKQHLIIVPTVKDKNVLREKIGQEPYIYTIKDYLKSEYLDKSNQVVSFYRSEKMHLNQLSEVLSRNYTHQNTSVLFDTGGQNTKGILRDLAIEYGAKEHILKESAERKNIVIMNGVDKAEQLNMAVKAYMSLSLTNKNAVLQITESSNTNTNLREKLNDMTRSALLSEGVLGERTASIQSKEPLFIKRDENGKADYTNPANYQKGVSIEKTNNGKTERWLVENVNRRNKTIDVINQATGEQKKGWSMSKLNSDYKLFKTVKEIEVRAGDKLRSFSMGNGIREGRDLTVTGITKANIFTKQKIKLEDAQGKKYVINAGADTHLGYGYVETVGRSQDGKRDVIIAVLQDNQTNSKTLSDVQKGGDRVLAITATNDSVLAKRIDSNNAQISVTRSLEKRYDVRSLDDIKAESLRSVLENPRLKREVDSRIEALQAKGNWVSFNAMELILATESSRFTKNEITQYVAERIQNGDFLPMFKGKKDLYENFYLKQSVENEKYLLNVLDKGVGKQEPILPQARELLANTSLNEGQRNASEMILTNRDTIVSVQGYAGVGKTYQLNAVADLIQQHRPDIAIKALAPTHKAKEELLRGNNIKDGDTFANFLVSMEKSEERFDKTLFIIDESSMIGNKTGQALLDTIISRGGRIVLSGDHSQLSALETGDLFRLGQQFSHANKAEMSELVRQTNSTMKNAAIAIAIDKDIDKAMNALKSQENVVPRERSGFPESSVVTVGDKDSKEHYKMIAEDYVSRTFEAQEQTTIITATNKHRTGINDAIQSERLSQGNLQNGLKLTIYRRQNESEADLRSVATWKENIGFMVKNGEQYYQIRSVSESGEVWLDNGRSEKMINVADSTSNLAIYKVSEQTFFEGDIVRVNATDKNKLIENNAIGRVISTDDEKLKIDFGNGNIRTLDPKNNETDRHIDLGYTITTMSSQGGSFEYVISYVDTDMKQFIDLKNTNVEITRAKAHFQQYVTDVDKYIEIVKRNSGLRDTAYEVDRKMQLAEAESNWNHSRQLSNTRYKERFEDNLLTQNAKLHFLGNKGAEILLETVDRNGNYTGNLALQVNPYRGQMNLDNPRLDTIDNAQFVILHQGDSDKEMRVFTLDELDKIKDIKPENDQTIVIVLEDKEKDIKLSDVLASFESINEPKEKELEIHKELEKLDHQYEQFALKSEAETDKDKQRLGNDEMNILRHQESETLRIDKGQKEKELV